MRRKNKEASRIISEFCILSFELCKVTEPVRRRRRGGRKCKLGKSPKCAKFSSSERIRAHFLIIAIRHDPLVCGQL